MEKAASGVQAILDEVALRVVTLEADDIPGLGLLLSDLDHLAQALLASGSAEVSLQIVAGLRAFTERLILQDERETLPLEDAVRCLQEMERVHAHGDLWTGDLSGVLDMLQGKKQEDFRLEDGRNNEGAARIFQEQDLDILSDFVVEASESLEKIEVSLIDLEDEPEDAEILNAIFRPFHTIKGVSGFLDLFEINRLAHSTENLLDSVRQGSITVNRDIVDMILTSVDFLRRLIGCVETGLANQGRMSRCDVDITPLIQRMDTYEESRERLGEILIRKGLVSEDVVCQSLEQQKVEGKPLGEILVAGEKVASNEVSEALLEQKKSRSGMAKGANLQVKVDTGKLDNLVDLTGELVIAQAMLRQQAQDKRVDFSQNMGRLGQIVSGIQKLAMSMRMVQIGSTFQKMVRLVRELSRSSGKNVSLEMTGQDTEIDRNVVETLYEPMVHMIRNAVDHGLEMPEERKKAGKTEKGTIGLQAYHKGGSIVIEMSDDGRGLNADRLLAKGMEKGLIPEGAHLKEQEIFDLIFHPGFSTAAAITDVSGRGVGMDVVKRVVETLRGRLEIRSSEGEGTTFVMTLPLTMAIIEGMLIRIGRERYIIPAIAIVESFRPSRSDVVGIARQGEVVMVRGELVPLLRLGKICGIHADFDNPWEAIVVVVENKGRKRALLLDELLGKEEFVIKSMGETFGHLSFLAGGTILGDGHVGLILDMAGLFDMADGMPPEKRWHPAGPEKRDEEGP
ncbi:chemotaxis protein CheA [Desulfobotulus sp. H1]|uniref:Chemotaxis protein CheA n=1 Tax=Desulfobotulus pelophilus TaxID=2823377 RepID=A0ABT3ND11_9BACT|nr:chemotaxis protein CheA [Desulfobotulus pelophilus]MCW7755353.1 chemotaxis protein CheA [Desulfobotulus pelophilus]